MNYQPISIIFALQTLKNMKRAFKQAFKPKAMFTASYMRPLAKKQK